ncbi:DEAD/DEAH box helicase family protein [Roseomonas sp. GC11]|uniref:DEAD/DEAH box helicase family protein n=1 Tax=Roseomonas sp. GC11 TaxID=2950546 RepID=UPI00210ECDCA|nr:DEAD/DEAH box helicase family protein [Roseomonas sp. GC11]MCQ4162648.1 DEAD/DEAH box helicase family protein [Roseomonas sp. GC11]
MSQFGFLQTEWPDLHAAAARAEAAARGDPRASLFYARRFLELTLAWLYRAEQRLTPPAQDNLASLLQEPSFRRLAGEAVYRKAVLVKDAGNRAVHSNKPVAEAESRAILAELFQIGFWLARHYARTTPPPDSLAFDPQKIPPPALAIARQSLEQLRRLNEDLRRRDEELEKERAARASLDAELAALRAEVAKAAAANAARPDTHDYAEAQTRDLYIDSLLREAGWDPQAPGVVEVPVTGMPNASGTGFVDYVLWGTDGKPLAVVEAKATRHSPAKGQQQAKLYADALERMHGQRPVIFTTNGYEHWLWDDTAHPPREVQGFYRREELELLVQRRTTRRSLGETEIRASIAERPYQTRAIRRIGESFEQHNRRKALVVMATGAGKTRTVIALCDMLMRANWAKRILFLADRTALVQQAVNAFKTHLPEAAPVNLLADRGGQGRVYVSTYPTMMTLIDEIGPNGRRFGPGHFDLIIVDEAHRSIYRRYRAIFRWFDSLLVGLTATPKDEIDKNTYSLFDLDTGIPTDAYPLEDAVKDGYLAPMRAVSVPLKFQREGIHYDQLSEEDRERWDEMEWEEEDGPPDRVEAEAVNQWLFNQDTVDKVLQHLMTHGQKVEGGDRIGKTIIFAKNHRHAEFIQQRFDANYPQLKGSFARVIDFQVDYAQSLIDDFSNPAKVPHIAISVDMLDTGIDVPQVMNLVFFKLVRSKTKFWQMIGRGTRLCPDVFGAGQNKEFFYVFDFCQNLEFFSQDVPRIEGSTADSLSARLFRARLEVITSLDARRPEDRAEEAGATLRADLAARLRAEVAAMPLDNFLVRPHRRMAERFSRPEAWEVLDAEARDALSAQLAGLPAALEPERIEAKQFDLLLLNLQLCVLGARSGYDGLRDKLSTLAAALAEGRAIPAIAAEMPLILDLQSDAWWQDVSLSELEAVRRRLRGLVHLIERAKRPILYTNFTDEIGPAQEVVFETFVSADAFARFREKARSFLQAHEDHVAVHRLRGNLPLTPTDLAELERMLVESGTGTPEEIEKAKAESEGLGLFVRSLVGLDRAAAQQAVATFIQGRTLSANQLEFIQIIIENLTRSGVVDPGRLYEAPYTRLSAKGVEGVFREAEVVALIDILDEVRRRAVA